MGLDGFEEGNSPGCRWLLLFLGPIKDASFDVISFLPSRLPEAEGENSSLEMSSQLQPPLWREFTSLPPNFLYGLLFFCTVPGTLGLSCASSCFGLER